MAIPRIELRALWDELAALVRAAFRREGAAARTAGRAEAGAAGTADAEARRADAARALREELEATAKAAVVLEAAMTGADRRTLSDLGRERAEIAGLRNELLATAREAGLPDEAVVGRIDLAIAMLTAAMWIAREGESALRDFLDTLGRTLDLARESGEAWEAVEDSMEATFGHMGDLLADFVTGGRIDFRSFVDSVVAEIAELGRTLVRSQIVGPLGNWLVDWLGSLVAPGPATYLPPPPARKVLIGHAGGIVERLPAFPRHRAGGGIAGLRADEVPVVARRGEGIFTPEQMAAMSPTRIDFRIENRAPTPLAASGPPRIEIDGERLVATVVVRDIEAGGPIADAIARMPGR